MAEQAQADVVAGYAVLRRLGTGGMGTVYLVRHPQLHRLMALKVMTAASDDERARARFLREAALAGSLSHPHLVAVYDQDEVDGVLHLTMQHVDGPDLGRHLRRGRLALDDVAEGVLQLADALDALHGAGLVHRDVKPSNVLLAPAAVRGGGPHWMLADFGIARALDESSELTGAAFVGSVAYSAPERFRGDPGSPSTDVFALACLAHEAFTGAPPFGRGLHAVLGNHARAVPPAGLVDLPPRVADALRSGLALTPEDRTASAGEFAAALAEAVRDPWEPAPARARRTPRRRPAVVGVALSGVLATAVAAALLLEGSPGSEGTATGSSPAAAAADARLQAYTALPAGVVPGAVAADGAGGAWVTDDAGSRVLHVGATGTTTSAVVPAVAEREAVALPEETADDRSVAGSDPTTSRRALRSDGAGGVWFADGTQVGRVFASGAVEVLRGGVPAPVTDLLAEEDGAWLSLETGDALRIAAEGAEVVIDTTAVQPADGRWPDAAPGARWTVDDGAGGSWVLEDGALREVGRGTVTEVPLSAGAALTGTGLLLGPGGALFWLDDLTGRVGQLDPTSTSSPQYLRLPGGGVPRGLAAAGDRLLVTSTDAAGRAGLLAVPPEGQGVDAAVTDDQRAAVDRVLDAYRSAGQACGLVDGLPTSEAQLPCLVGPLRALDDGLAGVDLPSGAGLARDDVRSSARDAADVFTALADPEAVPGGLTADARHPVPVARPVDVAMSVDQLRTALGLPRRGAVV